MKKLLLPLIFAAAVALPATADTVSPQASITGPVDMKCQWINGYVKKDGTFVSGHWRGCP